VATPGDRLGESPVWDPRIGQVAWIDAAETSALNTLDWATGIHHRVGLPTRCTAIGLTETPGIFVAALGTAVGVIDSSGAVLSSYPIKGGSDDFLTNDGACDPFGAFWFGTTTSSREPLAGSLWRFDGAHVKAVGGGYTLSNGIAWLPDGSGFFHVDTLERVVKKDSWGNDTRELKQAEFLTFTEADGLPDGAALDSEGGLWIAFWGASQVRRYSPDGTLDYELLLPVPNVTAVAFGGSSMSTLLVTTARSSPRGAPMAGEGYLYAADVGVSGPNPLIFRK